MKEIGLTQGKRTPRVFSHEERNMRVVVHGDDATVLGREDNLDWFRGCIKEKYLGPGKGGWQQHQDNQQYC